MALTAREDREGRLGEARAERHPRDLARGVGEQERVRRGRVRDVARRASEGDRLVRGGNWNTWSPAFMVGTQVTGKRFGVIGMGRIGQAVAKRAAACDMRLASETLAAGIVTADIALDKTRAVSTAALGDAIVGRILEG